MKKIWKFALATSAIAGLIPFHFAKDEESGASVKQALLWSCVTKPNGDKTYYIGLHIGKMSVPKAEEEETTEDLPIEEEITEEVEEVVEEAEELTEDATVILPIEEEIPGEEP
ncbi:MAG: hypothetical protein IKT58_00565 [Oscillospiraceae bacterium]|nr:hypothetical protein [Oscillospiraceae bacterium]